MAITAELQKKAEELRPLFEWAGKKWDFSPALLAAIALRESECGLSLDENGLGDSGHGHGIMQVDDRSFEGLFDDRYPSFWTDPMWSISTGAAILDAKLRYLENNTDLQGAKLLWAAVAAYNCGEGRLRRLAPELAELTLDDDEFWDVADSYTAHRNYARNVSQLTKEFTELWAAAAPVPSAPTPGPTPPPPEPAVTPAPGTPSQPTVTPAPTPPVTPASPPAGHVQAVDTSQTYIVKPGDTLSKISKKIYGDAKLFEKLALYNCLCDPNLIYVNQRLEIPSRDELLGITGTVAGPGGTPPTPPVEIVRPATAFPPPNGLGDIFDCFGDARDYMSDGDLNEGAWTADVLGRSVLPFAIPLAWDRRQSVTKIMCHKKLVEIIPAVFAAIEKAGLRQKVIDYGGCYNFRSKRGSGRLSTHSWGIAIDLNPNTNRMGEEGDIDQGIVDIFRQFGFKWGGDWSGRSHDPMHFQYCVGY